MIAVLTCAWRTAGLFTRAIQWDLLTVIVWQVVFGSLGSQTVLVVLQGP